MWAKIYGAVASERVNGIPESFITCDMLMDVRRGINEHNTQSLCQVVGP